MTLKEFANQQQTNIQSNNQAIQSLQDFSNQIKVVPATTATSLKDFANQQPNITVKQAEPSGNVNVVSEKMPEESKTESGIFRWIGKQLMKPQGIAVKEIKGVSEYLGSLLSIASGKVSVSKGTTAAAQAFAKSQQGVWNVLSGKETTSWSKELKESKQQIGIDEGFIDKAMGIGSDFVLDPLWIIKPVKIGQEALKITKLEKPVKVLADLIKKAPATKKVQMLFTNTTGNKEFDTIVKKFRNLREYRETNLIEDAVKLQKDIKGLAKQGIKNAEDLITQGLENPQSLLKIKNPTILNWVGTLKNTYKNLLTEARNVGLKVGEIIDYAPHIRTKTSFLNTLKTELGLGIKEFSKGPIEKGRTLQGTIDELVAKGIDIFEKNPAIQLVKKGQMYAKAITSAEFANTVKKFAVDTGVEVTNPLLKGLKFLPEQAKVIDNFYQGIKPSELKVIVQGFDKIQNWWKAQALISPSYHIRNVAGNLWNNFLAGVTPDKYFKAGYLQKGLIDDPKLIEEMKQLGVINEGWYAKDIADEVINRVSGAGKFLQKLNPFSQQNYLFQLNKKIGSTIENNARIAHYLEMIGKSLTPEKAAESVKKFLFDYGDLTKFEQNVMKRIIPFYTWTRKNIPVQLSNLITQPAKFVLPQKVINLIESGVEQPDEKYMSSYITENVPVRIRKNNEGNTEYFLLGNWLPYAQAIDILSRPLQSIVEMTTPLLKTPFEYLSNKSTYFKNTLGEPSAIENRYKQQGEFLGMSLRNKTILLLKNIRILNDLQKWIDKQDPQATKDSWIVKLLNTLFGKTATYDIEKSKYFYDMDTEDRINELKKAIKDAEKRGYTNKANDLRNELLEFQQIRSGN